MININTLSKMKSMTLLILFSTGFILSANSQEIPKKLYTAYRIENAPVINGDLSDDAWMINIWEGDFIQHEPYEGRLPSQPTEFKVCYDDLYLYLAIKSFDSSPDSITNRMSRRDNADGDMVFVLFDSYHDLRTGFVFGVSSAGVRFDMIMSNDGQNEDETWDPIWQAKAKIHEWGWAAEMKIPFTQLRFQKNSEEVWGLLVARQIFRHNEMSFWQEIPRNSSGMVHAIGEMNGLQGIEPRKQFDLTPYAIAAYNTYEQEENNPFSTGSDPKFNAGLDAKIGVTNNLTLDLTLFPDFGQVEADPSVVNLTAFETFFEEKRPFFIEGNSITSFNVGLGNGDVGNDNLFYSRRIGRRPHKYPSLDDKEFADVPSFTNIIGATKLTGKTEDGLSIGIVEAVTSEVMAKIDNLGNRSKQVIEPLTNYSLARIQKDFNKGNTIIGGAATSTIRRLEGTGMENDLHKNATTAGIDFTRFFNKRNYMITGSLYMSNVQGTTKAISETQQSSARYFQRPDAGYLDLDTTRTSLTGFGGNLQAGKIGGHWNFLFLNTWKSPRLEINDMGYMKEANMILNVLWTGYNFTEPFSIFRRLNLNNDIYTISDFGGNLNGIGYEVNVNAGFKNFWNAGMGGGYNIKQVSNDILRGGPSMLLPNSWRLWYSVSTDERKKIALEIFGNLNRGAEDYTKRNMVSTSLIFRPVNTLSISVSPSYSTAFSELQYMTSMDLNDEERYIFATLNQKILSMSLRVNYNITPDLTIQYWGQPFSGNIKFSDLKIITDPVADSFSDRLHTYTDSEITFSNETYYIDNGEYSFDFEDPDFTTNEWLSNLVVRWEFLPGSTAYLVWSQSRDFYQSSGNFDILNNLNDLFTDKKANNIFLIKFSYRFGLR